VKKCIAIIPNVNRAKCLLAKKGRIQMLKLEQIKKSYDGVEILKEMNLEIEDGEIVSILGPSGCGKTTLLNLILGITEADSGKIWFDGEEITNLAMEKRGKTCKIPEKHGHTGEKF